MGSFFFARFFWLFVWDKEKEVGHIYMHSRGGFFTVAFEGVLGVGGGGGCDKIVRGVEDTPWKGGKACMWELLWFVRVQNIKYRFGCEMCERLCY